MSMAVSSYLLFLFTTLKCILFWAKQVFHRALITLKHKWKKIYNINILDLELIKLSQEFGNIKFIIVIWSFWIETNFCKNNWIIHMTFRI